MCRRRFRPTHSEDRIFRCKKCGYVYTDDPDVDRSRCIQCGKLNEPIVF
jgi:predicted Zn-ribbon and HTH transcriptional regulator